VSAAEGVDDLVETDDNPHPALRAGEHPLAPHGEVGLSIFVFGNSFAGRAQVIDGSGWPAMKA
jgi:hypothetical protein